MGMLVDIYPMYTANMRMWLSSVKLCSLLLFVDESAFPRFVVPCDYSLEKSGASIASFTVVPWITLWRLASIGAGNSRHGRWAAQLRYRQGSERSLVAETIWEILCVLLCAMCPDLR
jgi:hypothetical protein